MAGLYVNSKELNNYNKEKENDENENHPSEFTENVFSEMKLKNNFQDLQQDEIETFNLSITIQ